MENKPKTLKQAISDLRPRFMGAEDWFNKSEDEFAGFCQSITLSGGIGMQIRNSLELWDEQSPLHKHMKKVHNMEHPDDMSDKILRELHKKVKLDGKI